MDGMGGMMIVWALLLVALLVLAGLGIAWLIRNLSSRPGTRSIPMEPPGHEQTLNSAEEALRRRYARGEIDRDEYLQRRDDLRDN